MGKEYYYLDLGDLAYNLFYILMKNGSDIKEVSFSQLTKYKEIIKKEAKIKNMELVFLLSRDETTKFFMYNEFTFAKGEDNNSIVLQDGITPYHLMNHSALLPLDVNILLSGENLEKETLDMMNVKSEKEVANIKFYLEELTRRINEFASKMEFEKCIELREKLRELQSIDKMLSKYDNENSINGEPKPKVLTKTRNEDKNEPKQD